VKLGSHLILLKTAGRIGERGGVWGEMYKNVVRSATGFLDSAYKFVRLP
jgi:hypothetical protein